MHLSDSPVGGGGGGVHLYDLRVPWFGPQQPGVPPLLQRAPVVRSAVTVQDVVAMETQRPADLLQLEVLRLIREEERPQRRLLQDATGSGYNAAAEKINRDAVLAFSRFWKNLSLCDTRNKNDRKSSGFKLSELKKTPLKNMKI